MRTLSAATAVSTTVTLVPSSPGTTICDPREKVVSVVVVYVCALPSPMSAMYNTEIQSPALPAAAEGIVYAAASVSFTW